tara:strand:+ start:4336 stop:5223 length:888 start_codon:yes stop_codon:yes gene_type:complete
MAKNLTSFVKSIGSSSGASTDRVWDFSNERVNSRAFTAESIEGQVAWCVPPGISSAKFELWGAGGAGGGTSSCCGISPPSSAGAYAYKTISVTPGDCYQVFTGITHCSGECRNATDKHIAEFGGSGCPQVFHTYVIGTGLTNFCAEKGNNSCYITCGSYTDYNQVDSDTTFLWNDSENAPQACYYGADGGHRGWNSYLFAPSQGNPYTTGQYCTWRFAIAYPAGLITQKPGRWMDHMCCHQSTCIQSGFAKTFGYNSGCKGAFMAGAGTAPAMSCGGANNCAALNQPGRVKITYS